MDSSAGPRPLPVLGHLLEFGRDTHYGCSVIPSVPEPHRMVPDPSLTLQPNTGLRVRLYAWRDVP